MARMEVQRDELMKTRCLQPKRPLLVEEKSMAKETKSKVVAAKHALK
jgi:hypothetical protein